MTAFNPSRNNAIAFDENMIPEFSICGVKVNLKKKNFKMNNFLSKIGSFWALMTAE